MKSIPPFDPASDAGFLLLGYGFTAEYHIEGVGQIFTAWGNIVARTTVVHLSVINQPQLTVKQVEFWGAGGVIGTRYLLSFIEEIGKRIRQLKRHLFHAFIRIIGIPFWVVAVDRDESNALFHVALRQFDQGLIDQFHIGAVVADKHHHGCLVGFQDIERKFLPADGIAQRKARGLGAEWKRIGLC